MIDKVKSRTIILRTDISETASFIIPEVQG